MGKPLSPAQRQRNVVAALAKHRAADDPALVGARGDLAAERLATYIRHTVDGAPPLDAAQRDRLALLLKGGDAA